MYGRKQRQNGVWSENLVWIAFNEEWVAVRWKGEVRGVGGEVER